MRTECYPIITDFFGAYDAKEVPFDEKWHVFQRLGRQTYLMIQNISGDIRFSPLFIHTFPLLAPHHLLESEKFNIRFPDPSKITETADKLRWYRYTNCVHQKDIAKVAGIDRTNYIDYESGRLDFYPIAKLKLIAEFYGIEVTELLDDYNLYMYKGQGWQVRALRKSMGMTQYQFGALEHPVSVGFPVFDV